MLNDAKFEPVYSSLNSAIKEDFRRNFPGIEETEIDHFLQNALTDLKYFVWRQNDLLDENPPIEFEILDIPAEMPRFSMQKKLILQKMTLKTKFEDKFGKIHFKEIDLFLKSI